METKFAKVLGSDRRVVLDLKRKRPNSSIRKLNKWRKLEGSKNKCGFCASRSKKSLLMRYSNFMRSGVPRRIMFYQNGKWSDFPQDFVGVMMNDLQRKKAAFEVDFNGHLFLLDFLHMMRLELGTGLQQPIAWIDEAGKCFFPEIFADDDKFHECCHHDFAKDMEQRFPESHGYQDIRLQLEIAVNESDCPKDNVRFSTVDKQGEMDSDSVRKIFFMGMGSFAGVDIVDLYRGSSALMQARLELFCKQVEITKKYRGDANVQYAWLPSSKEAMPRIMTYGLGFCGTPEFKSTYGMGVHLSPANCTINSAIYCDVDENGVRHMVFCRVIMGNVELVNAGSKQSHPSTENHDSGVDDLENPRTYIVWNMNKNTHIFPEFAISFKASSDLEGFLVGNQSKLDRSRVQLDLNSSPAQSGMNCPRAPAANTGSRTPKIPKSPWMPFPMLFAALSNKVPPEGMKLVETNYKLFVMKKISRDDFVAKLRMIAGNDLLWSILTNLQSKARKRRML